MINCTTSLPKNMYIDKLDDIVNKCNNTYHSPIKMKPVDVNWSTYFDFDKKNNKENSKFNVDGHVRISKFKSIFAKVYLPNWSEEAFVTKKIKILCCGHISLVISMVKEFLKRFMKKSYKKIFKDHLK